MNPSSSFAAFLLQHPLPTDSGQAAPAASSSAGPLIAGQSQPSAEPGPTLGLSGEFSIDDFLDMSQFELDHGGGLGLGLLEADEAGVGLGPPLDLPAELGAAPDALQLAPARAPSAASTSTRSVSFAEEPQVMYFEPDDIPRPSPALSQTPAKSSLRGATPFFPPPSPELEQPNPSPSPVPIDTPSPHARESSGSASPEPSTLTPKSAVKARRKNFAKPTRAPIHSRTKPAPPPPPPAQSTAGPPPPSRKQPREPELKVKLWVPSRGVVTAAEEGEVEVCVPDEHWVIPEEVLDQLETDDQAVPFPRLGISADDGSLTVVGAGDVVEISPDFGTDPGYPWLGLVTAAQGLTADQHQVKDVDGTPKRDRLGRTMTEFATAYVGLRWAYGREDFAALKQTNNRVTHLFTKELHSLGRNERVLTDHEEQYRQGRVAKGQVRSVYFNDRYPAPGDTGLVGSRAHPLRVTAHSKTVEYDTAPPSYLFGPAAGSNGNSQSDGDWTGACVIRTELALQGEPVVKPEREDVEHKPRAKKRKHGLTLYPPKQHSTVNDHKHLTFNRFGPNHQPYQFDEVQLYSHAKKTWYTLPDLHDKHYYQAVPTSQRGEGHPPESSGEPSALAPLARLGRDPIVRGGPFGVTGNAYLVTRAKEIVVELDALDSDSSSDGAEVEGGSEDGSASAAERLASKRELLEEAVVLLAESEVWKGRAEVARRRDRRAARVEGRMVWPLCPSRFGQGVEQRWVSRADNKIALLSRHEDGVLRQWEEEGLWKAK